MYPFFEEYLYRYRAARIFEFEKARISNVEWKLIGETRHMKIFTKSRNDWATSIYVDMS